MDEIEIRLQRLVGGPRKGRGDACPPAEEWASLAAGLVEAGRREALVAHASQCDFCGAMLHAVVEDFLEDVSGERQSLGELESSTPEWRRKMASRMAVVSSPGRVIPMKMMPWLARAAVVFVAVGVAWLGWNLWVTNDPSRLIAKAYTRQRPFEFRIPGAERAAVRLEKGAAGSHFRRPPELLEAEARIARELENDPSSSKWLQLKARAELLVWDPDTAIATLQRAQARRPADPVLLADVGVAYALRAEAQNRPADYDYAAQSLTRSLQAKPDNAAAVFNLALVYQRMSLYRDAERQWRRYLDLDAAGAWRLEAQRRLAEVERRTNSYR